MAFSDTIWNAFLGRQNVNMRNFNYGSLLNHKNCVSSNIQYLLAKSCKMAFYDTIWKASPGRQNVHSRNFKYGALQNHMECVSHGLCI